MGAFADLHNPLTVANHDLVHGFIVGQRRGAAPLAERLGIAPGTLSNKVNPDNEAHLSPEEWVAAMINSGNFAPLRIAAHQCHHAAVTLPDTSHLSDMELLTACLNATREFGELAEQINLAIDDGMVTRAELRRVEKALIDATAAQFEVVARLRSLAPDAPADCP